MREPHAVEGNGSTNERAPEGYQKPHHRTKVRAGQAGVMILEGGKKLDLVGATRWTPWQGVRTPTTGVHARGERDCIFYGCLSWTK